MNILLRLYLFSSALFLSFAVWKYDYLVRYQETLTGQQWAERLEANKKGLFARMSASVARELMEGISNDGNNQILFFKQ